MSTWFTRRFVTLLGLEQSGFTSWNLLFFANGAEVGGVRERALGPPTRPLAHWPTAAPGGWRQRQDPRTREGGGGAGEKRTGQHLG